jgi:hypothetical protein
MDPSELQAYFGTSVADLPSCLVLKVGPRSTLINCMDCTVSNRGRVANELENIWQESVLTLANTSSSSSSSTEEPCNITPYLIGMTGLLKSRPLGYKTRLLTTITFSNLTHNILLKCHNFCGATARIGPTPPHR